MTAEEFKKYAVDLFSGKVPKFQDTSQDIFKIKYATKMFVEKKTHSRRRTDNACKSAETHSTYQNY